MGLFAPTLVHYEVANALRYNRALNEAEKRQGLDIFTRLGIQLVPPSAETLGRALKVALAGGLSLYDAAYIALAGALGGTVVTADKRLARAAPRHAWLLSEATAGP